MRRDRQAPDPPAVARRGAAPAAASPTWRAAPVSAREQTRIPWAVAGARAANTRRTYAGQWVRFESWCRTRGTVPLPAAPLIVAAYLAERADTTKTATVRVVAAAIGSAHRACGLADPTAAASVRAVVAGIPGQHASRPDAAPRQAAPLSLESAVRLLALAPRPRRTGRGLESPRVAAARGLEDGAIVSLAFCAGLRRSEIAALHWPDVADTDRRGQLRVRVRASRTNPKAVREDYRLLVGGFAGAVDALRGARAPAAADRVIPLSAGQINRRLQTLAELAGLSGVSSDSVRRGLAAKLVRHGASTAAIQQAGG